MRDFIEVNGVSLRYELTGPGLTGSGLTGPGLTGSGAPTLVLLHEMGGTLETWDHVAPCFSEVQVVRYDMRGAGLSEKIRQLSLDDLVDDLAALLTSLGIGGPLVMAGVAVGAAVGVRYAARHPDRVAKLLLMAPATGIPADRREATTALAREIEAGGLRQRVVSRLPATFPEAFIGDGKRLRSSRGRALANDPVSYGAYYRMLLDLDLTPDLRHVTCPTLVLAGTLDSTRPPERVSRDTSIMADARFEPVVSGHVMPMLTPEIVIDRLRSMLAP